MTSQEIEAAKAAFLARGGTVQTAQPGIAYGVSAEADKVKRAEARAAYNDAWSHATEQEAEQRVERVTQAYHVGGRRAAMDALND